MSDIRPRLRIMFLAGDAAVHVFEGIADVGPHNFTEKQIISATFAPAYLHGGSEAIVSDMCEVHASYGIITPVHECHPSRRVTCPQIALAVNFTGKAIRPHDDEVVLLASPKISNYYHWMTEGLPRSGRLIIIGIVTLPSILLSYQAYFAHGTGPRPLLPNRSTHPHVWETIEALGLRFDSPLEVSEDPAEMCVGWVSFTPCDFAIAATSTACCTRWTGCLPIRSASIPPTCSSPTSRRGSEYMRLWGDSLHCSSVCAWSATRSPSTSVPSRNPASPSCTSRGACIGCTPCCVDAAQRWAGHAVGGGRGGACRCAATAAWLGLICSPSHFHHSI